MSIVAPVSAPKRSSANRVKQDELAVDNYPCRVAQIIDMGRQVRETWDGVMKKYVPDHTKAPANMLRITYEFTTEYMKDENGVELEDKPRWLSEEFALLPLSSDLATSTKRMLAFDPGLDKLGGDWSEVLTLPCSVAVAHTGGGRAKVGNVAKPMKGMVVADLKNEPKVFTLDAPDIDVFRSFPEWIQDRIKGNLDFEGSALQKALAGEAVPQAKGEEKAAQEPVQDVVDAPEPNVAEEDEDAPW